MISRFYSSVNSSCIYRIVKIKLAYKQNRLYIKYMENVKNIIVKLIDLGVSKTAISKTMKISRQLIDYRLEKNLDFGAEEIKRLKDRYRLFVN
jgi:sugar diacid utilization regulator